MNQVIKNKKGVTLVELLAVIVILGIIAAIATVTIGNMVENQRARAAEATFDSIEEAARLYDLGENPAAHFTLQQMVTAGYIDLEGTLLFRTSRRTGAIGFGDIRIVVNGNDVTITHTRHPVLRSIYFNTVRIRLTDGIAH